MSTFEFSRNEDGSLSLEEAVGQAIGAGSMCWEHVDRAGVFQSDQAKIIVDELVRFIKEETDYGRSEPILKGD